MKFSLLLFILFMTTDVWGQETVEVKDRWGSYFVLKGQRRVKHGPYSYSDHGFRSVGMYENGRRVGRWNFYGRNDSLEQRYNYSTNQVEYYNPGPDFEFRITGNLKEGDSVRYPVVVQGTHAILKLLSYFSSAVRSQGNKDFKGTYKETALLHINENGTIEKLETYLQSKDDERLYTHPLNRILAERIDIEPASLNGRNVKSIIIYNWR